MPDCPDCFNFPFEEIKMSAFDIGAVRPPNTDTGVTTIRTSFPETWIWMDIMTE